MHRARFLKNIQPRRCMVENRNLYVVEWIDSAKGTVNVVLENGISVSDICKRWLDHLHVCC